MKPIPRISETEWEVMKVVWQKSPRSAGEILDELRRDDPSWHPKTAKTLIARLVQKGALGFRKDGRAYFYHPLVDERTCSSVESESFLSRVFGGSLKPLLVHMVEEKKLSASDIKELRKLLDGK
ncbi:MAG: BlaI/MecI/CopY family transcriptional regulator [Verrucomicrobiales bacterium]|nr:BlaI/MecI/CopY family transcriptional regulator [Verrucomicrobiales bacterium]